MEKVLIDSFVVPAESRDTFLTQARKIQSFIRTLPGFVEGYIYEHTDGESRYNFLTTAVWADEAAFESAKQAVRAENERQGVNVEEVSARLRVERVRSTYERAAY